MAKTLALGKRLGGAPAVHVSRPPPPTLHQLFARTSIEAESSGEIARITDDEEVDAAQADSQNRLGGSSPVSKGNRAQESAHRSPQNAFSSLSGALLLHDYQQPAAVRRADNWLERMATFTLKGMCKGKHVCLMLGMPCQAPIH